MSSTISVKEFYLLVDVNNFYVSCERVFRPDLEGKPVLVLSNNDGCVISRSKEAKQLNIQMGVPIFKIRDLLEKNSVSVFSSNYTLYADLSSRFYQTLSMFAEEVEFYSIDECFLRVSISSSEVENFAKKIKDTLWKWLRLPVCVGIAYTKTLSKLANKVAKDNASLNGVYRLCDTEQIKSVLENTKVHDIWGIGHRSTKFLNGEGIFTAFDFQKKEDAWIRKKLKITGLQIAYELRGMPCIEMVIEEDLKKGIMVSRSFGNKINSISELKEAISNFAMIAGEKLWKQGLYASIIQVFLRTDRYDIQSKGFYKIGSLEIPTAIHSVSEIIKYSFIILEDIFDSNHYFKKAGLSLSHLHTDKNIQLDLYERRDHEKLDRLNSVIMNRNQKKKFSLKYAVSFSTKGLWKPLSEKCSPKYTTKWKDLPTVN